LLDTEGVVDGDIPPLRELLDQLPFGVALHSLESGFPLRYCNRQAAQRLRSLASDHSSTWDPRLQEVAERVIETRRSGQVEIRVRGEEDVRLLWGWTISPLLDARSELMGLVSVVEDLSVPALARRRLESAVGQGMHLLLEIARLAEEEAAVDGFLTAVGQELAEMIGADRIAFNEYDPERRLLIPRAGRRPPQSGTADFPATLPCDAEASDLLSQVVFSGRVYRGTVDLTSFEFRPYVDVVDLSREEGSKVLFVPWRAGSERLGVLVAQRTEQSDDFDDEDAIVLIAAGHTAGLVCQRKRAEIKLAERARQLESLEEAKSSFLRLASHELRGPLTLLNGYMSMLSDPRLASQRQSEILLILQQAVQRMNLLVAQLTDAVRLEDSRFQLQRRKVDLREVVKSATGNVLPLWNPARADDFDLELPASTVPAVVDVFRIEMIVQNLLDNAFKYSRPGDRVRCGLQLEPPFVKVTVEDQGIGISKEEMRELFTRFGRIINARNSHIRGTGLGLFISQEIARMHGGEIRAISSEEGGSQFELKIPLPPGDQTGEEALKAKEE
jgi:signal transduction histidine kinase